MRCFAFCPACCCAPPAELCLGLLSRTGALASGAGQSLIPAAHPCLHETVYPLHLIAAGALARGAGQSRLLRLRARLQHHRRLPQLAAAPGASGKGQVHPCCRDEAYCACASLPPCQPATTPPPAGHSFQLPSIPCCTGMPATTLPPAGHLFQLPLVTRVPLHNRSSTCR